MLPGHPPWGPQADAALADVALARGDMAAALPPAGSAIASLQAAQHEDLLLEILLPRRQGDPRAAGRRRPGAFVAM